jgi:hypothetical protein
MLDMTAMQSGERRKPGHWTNAESRQVTVGEISATSFTLHFHAWPDDFTIVVSRAMIFEQ